MTITYQGHEDGSVTVIDGKKKKALDRAESIGLFPAAPFEWGSGTTPGAARLSIAIARHALGNDHDAVKIYQRLKYRLVAEFKKGQPWSTTKDRVLEIVEDIRKVERETSGERAAVAREPAPVVSDGGAGVQWRK